MTTPNNSMPTGFVDPYASLPDAPDLPPGSTVDCVIQAAIKFSNRDRALLQSVHFARPTIRITAAILIHRLCHELRKHNITEYDPAAYERAVGGLTITLGGDAGGSNVRGSEPHEQPDRQAVDRDDGRRGTGMARSPDSAPPVADDVAESRQGSVDDKKVKRTTRTGKGHKQV